jgi:hypothetical protein
VPTLYNSSSCGYDAHRGWRERHDVRSDCYMCGHPDEALVLAWEGEPVPEGMDRAARALVLHLGGDDSEGVCWHRSWRGYFELWATWPSKHGPSFRDRNFLPWKAVQEADPRLDPEVNYAAPYLADDANAVSPKAIESRPHALALTLAHHIGVTVVVLP